jgi:transcriptional regulator with GAF, ATPase, and Fis domain
MQGVFEVLPAIAASPSTVLILGETDTGKELMARGPFTI